MIETREKDDFRSVQREINIERCEDREREMRQRERSIGQMKIVKERHLNIEDIRRDDFMNIGEITRERWIYRCVYIYMRERDEHVRTGTCHVHYTRGTAERSFNRVA